MDLSPVVSSGLAKTILHGTVRGGRRKGRQRRKCQVLEGSVEQKKMEETGCEVICGAPTTLAVKGKMK